MCLLSILYLCLISKKPSVMNLQFEFCPPLGAPRGGQKFFFALCANLAPPYIYFCIRPWLKNYLIPIQKGDNFCIVGHSFGVWQICVGKIVCLGTTFINCGAFIRYMANLSGENRYFEENFLHCGHSFGIMGKSVWEKSLTIFQGAIF